MALLSVFFKRLPLFLALILLSSSLDAQHKSSAKALVPIDMSQFSDSRGHWYGIYDKSNIIQPKANQPTYSESEITKIADNIILYQRNNGGWPKNYDMQAILTSDQIDSLVKTKEMDHTTFDNSTTYTHVEYLAQVYTQTSIEKYKNACLKGIGFILSAQYPNGGWPQYFPLEKNNYSSHITFNDGAFLGVMSTLKKVNDNDPMFSFVGKELRKRIQQAYDKGLECILKCQIISKGRLTAWCQQYDEITLKPAWARAYEMPSICNGESVSIVFMLMSIENPDTRIISAVQSAIKWFDDSKILNTKVKTIPAPPEVTPYKINKIDRIVVTDSTAPPIWTRFYEIDTERPLFSDRNSKLLYSMAEVSRERRSGYGWYTYAPQQALDKYPEWLKKWAIIPRDTSFTPYSALIKLQKDFPDAKMVSTQLPEGVKAQLNVVYATLPNTPYGKRDLHLDIFSPAKPGKYPALLHIHGGGWRSGSKGMDNPLVQNIAAHGYVTATVEYRLSPEALYPAAIFDIKAAIRYLRANAAKLNIDPDWIALSGCSSGGHLAALIGTTPELKKFEGEEGNGAFSTKIQAIIDIDGVLDFTDPNESGKDTDPQKRSAGAYWIGETYKQAPEKWAEASPLAYAGKNTPPIMFLNSIIPRFHAGRDQMVTILNEQKIYSEIHTISNTPHPFWLFRPWFSQTAGYMVNFLDKILKQKDLVTVSQDGSADFTSIQKAIDASKAFPDKRVTIYVKNGTYKEKIVVPSCNTKLSIIGESAEKTIITYDDYFNRINRGRNSTFYTYTMKVEANDFILENITVENTAGPVGQAVALHAEGDRGQFRNCRIIGNQDTFYGAGRFARQYFYNCYIEGTTDFIFGEATILFEKCTIHSKGNSFITAASTTEGKPFGFVFQDCKLTAAAGVDKVFLGRPWRGFAKVAFLNCEMGSFIRPEGWDNWSKAENEKTAEFAEYHNSGPGAVLNKRVAWSKKLTESTAKKFTKEQIFVSLGWESPAGERWYNIELQ